MCAEEAMMGRTRRAAFMLFLICLQQASGKHENPLNAMLSLHRAVTFAFCDPAQPILVSISDPKARISRVSKSHYLW